MSATPLLDGLVAFLGQDGWPVHLVATPSPTVETRCAGDSAEWTCVGRTFEAQGQVVFDSNLPVEVPQELAGPVALLLSCLNWDLTVGAFAVDTATGGVRLRTALVVTGAPPQLGAEAAKALVHSNVLIVDRCLGALQEVAGGRLGIEAALERLTP
ncbi:MAG TPA: hypothetical protein VGP53_00610 [Acidimicrobiales bacterium]|nr:hypothetical protein [Acidimicrobiales bacterium]